MCNICYNSLNVCAFVYVLSLGATIDLGTFKLNLCNTENNIKSSKKIQTDNSFPVPKSTEGAINNFHRDCFFSGKPFQRKLMTIS